MKITMRNTNLSLLLIANTMLIGCNGQGVIPVNINDDATRIYGQATLTTDSGRKFQFEIEQYQAEGVIPLNGARDNTGEGEYRLRDGAADAPSTTLWVGPASVDSSHKVTQISAQVDFSWVDTPHFQLGWAPHLSYLKLTSDYRIPGESFSIDLQEPGIGAQINASLALHKQWGLNVASKVTSFSSDTSDVMHTAFIRFQPIPQLNIDLGIYTGTLDLNMDTGIVYEQRTVANTPCYEDCVYTYNNQDKSDLEIESQGYRMGIGWNF